MSHRAKWKEWFVTVAGRRFGLEISQIGINGNAYLDRWIAYLGGGTLRLHRFWRGDDDRASHTHPWWFITFPLTSYWEAVYKEGVLQEVREVKRFRFHFRPAHFEHIVLGRQMQPVYGRHPVYNPEPDMEVDERPFWTFVISGHRTNAWGFYPKPGKFVPWREWA